MAARHLAHCLHSTPQARPPAPLTLAHCLLPKSLHPGPYSHLLPSQRIRFAHGQQRLGPGRQQQAVHHVGGGAEARVAGGAQAQHAKGLVCTLHAGLGTAEWVGTS